MLTNSDEHRGLERRRSPNRRSAAGDRLGLYPGRRELAPGGEPLIRCGNRRAKSTEATSELLREPRLLAQPSTAFSRSPPVRGACLEGQEWVQKLWGRRQRSGTVVVVRKPIEVPHDPS